MPPSEFHERIPRCLFLIAAFVNTDENYSNRLLFLALFSRLVSFGINQGSRFFFFFFTRRDVSRIPFIPIPRVGQSVKLSEYRGVDKARSIRKRTRGFFERGRGEKFLPNQIKNERGFGTLRKCAIVRDQFFLESK